MPMKNNKKNKLRLHLTGQTFNVARQNRNVKKFPTPAIELLISRQWISSKIGSI